MHYHKELLNTRWVSIALCTLILLVAGGGSLGIIWMRTEITNSAVNSAQLERQARDLKNDNATLSARMARAHNPEFLVKHMPEGLRPTNGSQIVWIQAHPAPAYLAQAAAPVPAPAPVVAQPTPQPPATVSFDLALINTPRSPQP